MSLLVFEKSLLEEIRTFVTPVFDLKVSDTASMKQAQDVGKTIQSLIKKVEDRRKELVRPLDDQRDIIQAAAKEVTAPLLKAKDAMQKQLLGYSQEIERQRVEALRAKQEEERQRLAEQDAERRRVQDALEAKQKAEREAAEAMGIDTEEVADQQRKAAAETNLALIKASVEEQAKAEAEMREIQNMKVSGKSERWTFEIVDATLVPRKFLTVDEKRIREEIKLGAREGHIPGVRIYKEANVVFRG